MLLRPCWLLVERGRSASVTERLISTDPRLGPWEELKVKGGWNLEREWLSHHVIQHDLLQALETPRINHFPFAVSPRFMKRRPGPPSSVYRWGWNETSERKRPASKHSSTQAEPDPGPPSPDPTTPSFFLSFSSLHHLWANPCSSPFRRCGFLLIWLIVP